MIHSLFVIRFNSYGGSFKILSVVIISIHSFLPALRWFTKTFSSFALYPPLIFPTRISSMQIHCFSSIQLVEDKHNVILIIFSSSGFISYFRRLFILSHSRFKVFPFSLFRSSKLLADFVVNLHPNHRKDLILSLSSFNFISSFFCYRSSSQWLVMI